MLKSRCARILLCAASSVAQGQDARTTITAIQSLIRSQSYDQALQRTRAALQRAPGDPRLWTLEGIVFSIKGSNSEALNAFDKALDLSPDSLAALKGEVQLLYPAQTERAIPLLKKIVKLDPHDETAQEMLANLERKQGNCQAAVDHFDRIADGIATHPESLESYGYCLVATKQPRKAIPVFEELAASLPDQPWAQYDLAVVQVEAQQDAAALKTLDPLLAATPSDPELLSLASDAREAIGDTPNAVTLLRQAIVLSPSDPGLYTSFATLCLNHDSFQVGIDMLNAGLQRLPSDPTLYISRGLLYSQLAAYDKAEADFNTAEHLDKKQSLSAYAMDLSQMQRSQPEKDDPDKELADVRAQLKAHPESALLHYLLAKLLTNQGPDETSTSSAEALRSLRRALQLKPDLAGARDLLASIYLRSGKYDLAVEQCRLALQYAPDDQGAMYHLIIALRHTTQPGQSEEISLLVKNLSELQQASRREETARKRFRLVEEKTALPTR